MSSLPQRPSDAPVLLIGAMRSGTTLFHRLLTQHPEVCGARTKEPEFFTHEGPRLPGVRTFDDLFPWEPGRHRFALDASAVYATFPIEPDVPARVAAAGLRPKIFYLVRDPLERILSQYHYFIGRPNFSLSKPLTRPALLRPSQYGLQLKHFRETFPDKADYHVVDFDVLQADPQATAMRALAFLGLDPLKLPPDAARLAIAEGRNATPTRSPVDVMMDRRGLRGRLGWMPAPVRRLGRGMLRPLVPGPSRRRFTPEEEAEARAVLKEDLVGFKAEWGIDPAKWGL